MQQHNGVALSHLHICHLSAEDPLPLLLVRKCRRDHMAFSFFIYSSRISLHHLAFFSRVGLPQGRNRTLSREGPQSAQILIAQSPAEGLSDIAAASAFVSLTSH